ncbi:TetR/AcrR family transcriptional regulator [Mycobacterium sp. RTGN5]|uniref:TetR/AcrR family transcriptional regulator n=1 Tax=Mycobacterium sp. RTGN5 TaxID=3016522 RepID=UPI0029C6A9FD|nr:TetR family transcriptional regulator [Mycobacterium sp. RTGN5]
MPSATRWAGVSPADRQAERRALLVRAAFGLFGDGGEAAMSVRSVCRAAELNTRYFYESFTDTDALLGAVYDEVAIELGRILTSAMVSTRDERARLRAGIRAVLDFSSADPRRGKILFTEARTNPVLAARRTLAQDHVRELVLDEQRRTAPESDRVATEVGAAMYAGAMAELAQQWLAGTLGDDVDAVVAYAVRLLLPN